MPTRLDRTASDFESRFSAFLNAQREAQIDVEASVREIIDDVIDRGDAAVIDYTRRFDRFALTAETFRIDAAEINAAAEKCPPKVRSALAIAAERIIAFHEKQRPDIIDYTDDAGIRLGARWTPVDAAGLYVPGGLAAYPSSVLMNALPARVAGVKRLVMVVPTPDNILNPAVMAAAQTVGIEEIYRIGGAQAVAALAHGTESIQPVDKIVGPGNAYVATAKRQVFGTVGIDMIAGPSEILVVADAANDPRWIAADLLSQAEHSDDAQSVLITDDADFADSVTRAVDSHLQALPRSEIAGASWRNHGAVITVADLLQDAPALIDRIAPEHLELAVDQPDSLMANIKHAGAIFLGRHTPEAIGDYIAGPNHVLPTSRSARFSSGLNLLDFMKRTTWVGCTAEGLAQIGSDAVSLAEAEGLDAHALSVAIRLDKSTG